MFNIFIVVELGSVICKDIKDVEINPEGARVVVINDDVVINGDVEFELFNKLVDTPGTTLSNFDHDSLLFKFHVLLKIFISNKMSIGDVMFRSVNSLSGGGNDGNNSNSSPEEVNVDSVAT